MSEETISYEEIRELEEMLEELYDTNSTVAINVFKEAFEDGAEVSKEEFTESARDYILEQIEAGNEEFLEATVKRMISGLMEAAMSDFSKATETEKDYKN